MPAEIPERGFYRFGPYCLDIAQRCLLHGDGPVHLTPKAFDVLLILVQRHGQLVDKKFLMDAVWPDVEVEEGNLTFTVNSLRRVLADQNGNLAYIKNVRGRGYIFAVKADYEEERPSLDNSQDTRTSASAPLDTPSSRRPVASRHWLAALCGAAILALIADVGFTPWAGVHLLRDFGLGLVALLGSYFYRRASSAVFLKIAPNGPPSSAFRGLLPFESTDAERFYGRDIDAAAITDLVSHSEFKFGVLYGDSGCGKTSLIRAALVPRLEAKGYLTVHCRAYADPVAALREECSKRSRLAPRADERDIHYLERVSQKPGAGLIIICDQFEEFFINFPDRQDRLPFLELVGACYESARLRIKFLFAIRSDFLYQIPSAFDDQIPETLLASRRYHLRHFDEYQAEEVIEKSVRKANWQFESGFSRRIARDLAIHGSVLPSELQIVGAQIQNKRIFTLEEYRRAGGREQLVHSYLEDVIKSAPDSETAQLVLRCLISEEDTRLTLPFSEIEKRVQRNAKTIRITLGLLTRMRLVREIQDENPWRYELMHEYLITKINQTTGRVMDATQRANRQFKHYLSIYAVDRRTRIPIGICWSIHRYSDLERGERERELLLKSSWQGLLRWSTATIVALILAICAAAWMSVTEEWDNIRLSEGHTAGVRRAVFSPDGHLLVSGGEDGRVIVWDFPRRQRIATLTAHKGLVSGLAFSPDGKLFASSSSDQSIIVWDASTFLEVKVLAGHKAIIGGLAFSPNGRFLASSADRTILWDTHTWEPVMQFPNGSSEHCALFFSSDSRFLFSGNNMIIWDLIAKKKVANDVSFSSNWAAESPKGIDIVGIDSLGTVKFMDRRTRKLLVSYQAHQDNGRAVAYSPDGKLVATGAENVVLWDAIARKKIVRLDYPSIIWSLVFSPDGRWLLSTHGDGSIVIWDPIEHEKVGNLKEHIGAIRAVTYSHDGKFIASGGEDDSIIVWNVEGRQKEAVLIGHKSKITGMAFSPDDRSLASTDLTATTIYWDWRSRIPIWIRQNEGGPGQDNDLAISPDGRWVATSTHVYASEEGKNIVHYPVPTWGLAFSPNSRWLIYNPYLHFVVWDTQDWKLMDIDKAAPPAVRLSFCPDGKFFVTGGDDGAVRLWQWEPFREVAILGRHTNRIKSVAVSPDGKQAASSSDDQTIRLWDLKRRQPVTTIGTHATPVLAIAFSPDGKHLVSGEHDSSLRIYTRHHLLWGRQLD